MAEHSPTPSYPQVTITVPQKAVATETRLSLELKVGYVHLYDLHQYAVVNVCGYLIDVT